MEQRFNKFLIEFKHYINIKAIMFFSDKFTSNDITDDILKGKKQLKDINSIIID